MAPASESTRLRPQHRPHSLRHGLDPSTITDTTQRGMRPLHLVPQCRSVLGRGRRMCLHAVKAGVRNVSSLCNGSIYSVEGELAS